MGCVVDFTSAKYRAILTSIVICALLILNNWNCANSKNAKAVPEQTIPTKSTSNAEEAQKKAQANLPEEEQLDYLHMRLIGSGMPMGFNIIVLGVLIGWLGIEASFKLEGSGKGFSLGLATASPGVFLIIAGAVIILTCLIKPYSHISSSNGNVVTASNVGGNGKKEGVSNSVSYSESSKGIVSFWKRQKLAFETFKEDDDGNDFLECFNLLNRETEARKSIISSIIIDLNKSSAIENLRLNEQLMFYGGLFTELDAIKAKATRDAKKIKKSDMQEVMSKYSELSANIK